MARRVGDNKFSFFRGEIAVRDVNSNALLTLGLQPIDQQRQIEFFSLRAMTFTVIMQRRELIFINLQGIVQQTTYQRTFTVINAATG
ncbi:Uncharacterised protein [Salmonella enterica subsp. enterica serovar Bovismorbificans]|uniref:Uncharacterized protein n=1 Tax=Salmonella enterica subsp. enterica serovar Bovismorbificans TaxID=58097 RepID=A0A655ET49_SALET|nr:Uncharacterised protein [Salmonella enterica subsp. enterica serovar Bovismorbificans]